MRVLHTGALEQLVRKHRRVLDKEQRREGRRIDSDKDEKHGKRVARAERERGRAGREEREGRGVETPSGGDQNSGGDQSVKVPPLALNSVKGGAARRRSEPLMMMR